jgi:hypothetical protein
MRVVDVVERATVVSVVVKVVVGEEGLMRQRLHQSGRVTVAPKASAPAPEPHPARLRQPYKQRSPSYELIAALP